MGVGGQHHSPAALPPGKTRYPLYRRLGRPTGPVWTGAENLGPHRGLERYVSMKPVYVTIIKPICAKFVKYNRMRDKVNCTAKVKIYRIISTS